MTDKPAVLAVQLLISGRRVTIKLSDLDPGTHLEALTVLVDGQPISRIPFYQHGPGALHTVCSRTGDRIDTYGADE